MDLNMIALHIISFSSNNHVVYLINFLKSVHFEKCPFKVLLMINMFIQ